MKRVNAAVCCVLTALNGFMAELTANPTNEQESTLAGPVQVEIYENLQRGSELALEGGHRTLQYAEPVFAFVRIPTKYSSSALPLDRSTPFVLRASFERALPEGKYEFRVRAKGATKFFIDDQVLLSTEPQIGNTSGNDPVPPPPEKTDGPLRPVQYPHQEEMAQARLDGSKHRFVLVALIGGKGLAPSPGELSVSYARPGEVPRCLGDEQAPLLTDADWEQYAVESVARHQLADLNRRRAVSVEVVRAWNDYHHKARQWTQQQPGPIPPRVSVKTPVYNDIDRFIGARLEAAGAAASELTSDLEFLRRLYLDTIGMIPTAEEIRGYLADPPKQRRRRAIDRLLDHPGWADHWVSYWQDVLAENPGILKPDLNNSGPFRWWLHQSFIDNIPFDRLVAELIGMEGSKVQGGPAGFGLATLNDAPMAAKADILSQAFLAEKLSCARCHDAPHHPHKQKDTFSFAAMLEAKPLKLPESSTVPFKEGFRKPRVEVSLTPGEVIEPHWPFQEHARLSEITQLVPTSPTAPATRNQAAALIVSPENKRFAQVVVNRIWKRYLGAGLIEPAEDWDMAEPSHAELLQYLGREFILSGYDLKAIARLIFSSHLYQRKAVASALMSQEPKERLFAGPMRRRLSAEQLVDSLFRAAGKEFGCEELNLNPAGNRPLEQFLNLGTPQRAWQFTALMNERDRPALALPVAQSIVDVLTTFGWRQSRQNPLTVREQSPSPMQTLLLANGVMGTRVVRLSDDSAFTHLALSSGSLKELVNETFLKLLGRPPSPKESRIAGQHLAPFFGGRKREAMVQLKSKFQTDTRVSWANHLSPEATLIRMEEERQLRMGSAPTARLAPEFRQVYEDLIWSLVNSPEFILIP